MKRKAPSAAASGGVFDDQLQPAAKKTKFAPAAEKKFKAVKRKPKAHDVPKAKRVKTIVVQPVEDMSPSAQIARKAKQLQSLPNPLPATMIQTFKTLLRDIRRLSLEAAKPQRPNIVPVSDIAQNPNQIVDYDMDICRQCKSRMIFTQDSRLTCVRPGCSLSREYRAPIQSVQGYGEGEMDMKNRAFEKKVDRSNETKKAYRKFLQPYMEGAPNPPPSLLDEIRQKWQDKYHIRSSSELKPTRVKDICVTLTDEETKNLTVNVGEAPKADTVRSWKNHAGKMCRKLKNEPVIMIDEATGKKLIAQNTAGQMKWHRIKGQRTNFVQKSLFTNRALLEMGRPDLAGQFPLHKSKAVSMRRNQSFKQMAEQQGKAFFKTI